MLLKTPADELLAKCQVLIAFDALENVVARRQLRNNIDQNRDQLAFNDGAALTRVLANSKKTCRMHRATRALGKLNLS